MEGDFNNTVAGLPDAAPIALAVGIGNPGSQYEHTRHNAGIWFIHHLVQQRGWTLSSVGDLPARAAGTASDVRLGVTNTYMNDSARAVVGLADYFGLKANQLLVVHDELDFSPGVARYKFGGGLSGHNGLRDIRQGLGTDRFWRLRIGIGHPRDLEGDLANTPPDRYVLGKASEDQAPLIDECLDRCAESWSLIEKGDMDEAIRLLHSTGKT